MVGAGYVGMSLSVLLAQKNNVFILDIDPQRVEKVNAGQSTVVDRDMEFFQNKKSLSLQATLNKGEAYKGANFVIVATPTNYDPSSNRFNTYSVDTVIEDVLNLNRQALIIIKSTVPVGYTETVKEKFNTYRVLCSLLNF